MNSFARLARFGFGVFNNRPSCPIVCMAWVCQCVSDFVSVSHTASSSYIALALSAIPRSGLAWYFDTSVSPGVEVYSVCILGVVGVGLQDFHWGVLDPFDRRWRFLCSSLTNSSMAVNFVFASAWRMDAHSRMFSNLFGSPSDCHKQSNKWVVRVIAFCKAHASSQGSGRRWPFAIC